MNDNTVVKRVFDNILRYGRDVVNNERELLNRRREGGRIRNDENCDDDVYDDEDEEVSEIATWPSRENAILTQQRTMLSFFFLLADNGEADFLLPLCQVLDFLHTTLFGE